MEKLDRIFDGLLVLKFKGGDQKAMDILIKRHQKRLLSQARWYTGDAESAKDIVQDSWIKAMRKIHRLKDPNKFGSWMMTIVTRQSVDVLKKEQKELGRKKEIGRSGVPGATETKSDQRKQLLLKLKLAIEELKTDHQMVLRLFYLQEYSLREISEILKISPGTVKSRLYHAREKLKTVLK
ncbi:RNA polymerase sigma factor [Muriicola marianensis]|uniref:RNA polymerase sigma factor n=1 Tax=Muriicola marianensis TaxID=1324801 RepID=A0ABQ1QQC6_9FLAO|nr:RNA polymerase sigma factor [Muriicola marianensis]GGD36992.1 RNA polymerase sigma factor [Muriicola marianensis]